MKKQWMIIALIAVLLAGVAFVSGMSLLDWDFRKLDTATWESRSFQPENPVQTLSSAKIKVSHSKVILLTGDTLNITYEESEHVKYSIELTNDNELTVTENYQFHLNMFNFYIPEMRITLPPTHKLDLESTNGDLNLDTFDFQSFSVKLTNGNITLNNLQVANELYAKTANGTIKAENINATSIHLTSTNGAIKTNDLIATTINLKTTNGDVYSSAIKATVINTKSTNGNLELTIIGNHDDFTITTNTVNGNCYAPSGGDGASTLDAKTVNGNIVIKFITASNA